MAEKAENVRKVAEEKAKKVAETKTRRLAEKECRLAEKAKRAKEQRATQIIEETSNITTSNDFLGKPQCKGLEENQMQIAGAVQP